MEVVKAKVEAFEAQGGDLSSSAATGLGLELVNAFDEVARRLGYNILKPLKDGIKS